VSVIRLPGGERDTNTLYWDPGRILEYVLAGCGMEGCVIRAQGGETHYQVQKETCYLGFRAHSHGLGRARGRIIRVWREGRRRGTRF